MEESSGSVTTGAESAAVASDSSIGTLVIGDGGAASEGVSTDAEGGTPLGCTRTAAKRAASGGDDDHNSPPGGPGACATTLLWSEFARRRREDRSQRQQKREREGSEVSRLLLAVQQERLADTSSCSTAERPGALPMVPATAGSVLKHPPAAGVVSVTTLTPKAQTASHGGGGGGGGAFCGPLGTEVTPAKSAATHRACLRRAANEAPRERGGTLEKDEAGRTRRSRSLSAGSSTPLCNPRGASSEPSLVQQTRPRGVAAQSGQAAPAARPAPLVGGRRRRTLARSASTSAALAEERRIPSGLRGGLASTWPAATRPADAHIFAGGAVAAVAASAPQPEAAVLPVGQPRQQRALCRSASDSALLPQGRPTEPPSMPATSSSSGESSLTPASRGGATPTRPGRCAAAQAAVEPSSSSSLRSTSRRGSSRPRRTTNPAGGYPAARGGPGGEVEATRGKLAYPAGGWDSRVSCNSLFSDFQTGYRWAHWRAVENDPNVSRICHSPKKPVRRPPHEAWDFGCALKRERVALLR